jgi:glycosyltransferase involved in cell wall biosynthesis
MKISIVTISYNQADFLERAIISVIDQDYHDFEYIVVDPGSTDGSREIVERYSSKIDKIIFEPDEGPADGLNKGFMHATGEVYGFLNSDDVLFMGTLSKVANYFKEHHDIDVVSGDPIVIDDHDRPIRKLYSDRFSLIRYAYASNMIVQQSTFFRSRMFYELEGFNLSNNCAWDGELFVDIAFKGGRFAVVRDFWSGFRSHPRSITSSAKLDNEIREYRKRIFQKIMDREPQMIDRPLKWGIRIVKHLMNPQGVIERLVNGPVYGRDRLHKMNKIDSIN